MQPAAAASSLASPVWSANRQLRLWRRFALPLLAVIICCNCCCCKSAEAMSVSLTSNWGSQFIPEQSKLLLHCSVSERFDYIFWYYSGVPGGTDRASLAICYLNLSTCAIQQGFRTWNNLNVSANGTLSLTGLSRSQDGYYECEAFIDKLYARQGIRVVVVVSGSEPSIVQAPSRLTAGDRAALTCSSGSGWNPAPRLTWLIIPTIGGPSLISTADAVYTLPGVKFGPAQSVLSLTVDSFYHDAVVVCSAVQTEVSNVSVSAELKLLVEHKPTLAAVADLTAVEGSSVSLACSARGYPPPLLQLLSANGSVMQDSDTGLFSLSPVHRSQAGSLACRAVNRLGAATAAFRLTVLYAPTVRTPASVTVDAGGSVSVPCSVDGNPPPAEIVWRHIGTGAFSAPSSDGALRIEGADPLRHSGEWRCEARSVLAASAGPPIEYSASSAVILTVRYRPGPPVASQPRSPLLAGDAVNLSCQSSRVAPGQPAPRLEWIQIGAGGGGGVGGAPSSGSSLRFDPIGLADSGVYACRAVNDLGASESAPVSLLVSQAPVLAIDAASASGPSRVGSTDFRLVCRATANPAPRLRWLRNGERMPAELFTEQSGLGEDT